jgi:ATP-binding cassette subfamily B protein|tara:strand:- start:893 stop:2638 length:1746 start_codon:yes stop_codon:yes gene_type:complete
MSKGKVFDPVLLTRIIRYVKPYKKTFAFTGFLTLLLGLLGPVRPIIIQYTLDNAILNPNTDLLLKLTILMVLVLVIETFIQFFQTYYANWVGQTVIKDMRMEVYGKISAFKLKYFDTNAIGTLVTRAVSDIETIADVFSNGVLIIVGDLLKLIIIIVVMFVTDWRLALISMSTIPVLIFATKLFNSNIKKSFQAVRTNVSKLNAFVQEHITGMNIVQIFNRESAEYDKFKNINKEHRNAHINTVWANAIFFPTVELLSAVALALVVWFGSQGLLAKEVSFGNLVAFILYIHMLFRPIRQLADRFNTLQMGMVSSDRVFKILDTDSKIENSGTITGRDLKGEIEFRNLWFSYNTDNWILKDLNFKVKQGETIAFVGPTGAGKSSIVNLINRMYEFQKGDILMDGISIKKYEQNFIRRRIGVVLQDVFLFSDTIFNNITLNNPNVDLEEVQAAAKEVGAHDFIMKLPDNYHFNVGERGGVLSVGQRQLLAFIRAYLYDPDVLILDEATSSIDSESESLIQKATEKLTKDRTSIIIAHRLATIQKAYRIYVMKKGEIIENGNHQKLLALNGAYKKLYDIQFVED